VSKNPILIILYGLGRHIKKGVLWLPQGTLVTGALPQIFLLGGCGNGLPPKYPSLAESYS